MDPYLTLKIRFPPEEQPFIEPLSAFILSFIQALLKTGYYQSSHPGSTAAKLGLYQQWVRLGIKDKEISVIARETEQEIVIYGVLSEPVSLKMLFLPSVAELFVPKLGQYFNRHHLMSFTLKSGITREEFEGFVDIMTDLPKLYSSTEMTQKLVDAKIVHVSVVYSEDALMIERPMHWMARIALARLGKDLRIIPLYKHLAPEQMGAMKAQIFGEIIRPLSNWTVLKDVMVNCDILQGPKKGEPLETLSLEEELYKVLNRNQTLGLLVESARAVEGITPPPAEEPLSPYSERLIAVIKRIVQNLPVESHLSEELLERLLAKRVILLEDLSKTLVDAVLIKRKTDDYLQHKQHYWERLHAGWPKEASAFIAVLSVLLARDDFHSFAELLDHLHRAFFKTFGLRADFLTESGMDALGKMIVRKLTARRFETRKAMLAALEPVVAPLAPHLFPLCAHEDLWLRRNICRILADVGATIVPGLIAFAQEDRKSWMAVRNGVMILGDIGVATEAVLHFLRRCQQYPHIRVQEEVINSYGKIKGPETETFLLQVLEDSDTTLHPRAILALAHTSTVNARYRAYLQEALRRKQKKEREQETSVQMACCIALESLIPLHPELVESFEPILCNAVAPKKAFFGWLQEYSEKENDVQNTIFRLLGMMGTEKALPVLTACFSGKSAEDKDRIQQALQQIEQRRPDSASTQIKTKN